MWVGWAYINYNKGGVIITNLFAQVDSLTIVTNAKGDKVEQKQSRAIKSQLVQGFIEQFKDNYEIMYDSKGLPVIVLDNGLVIGFDFIVRRLDTELSSEQPKTAK